VLLLAGCQTVHPGREWWVCTELYFGLTRQGQVISEDQWRDFLDHQVTPRFPDGLSVLDMHGQWKDPGGAIVREPGKLLIILHPPGAEADRKIEALRSIYRRRFQQESVLRSDSAATVSF
jgi:hypothetical protein